MRVAKFFMDIQIYDGYYLKKDTNYVMAGAVMAQLQKVYPGAVIETEKFEDYYNKLVYSDLKKNDKVFLFRSGGIGDIMFMLPLIHFLKKTKEVKIGAASSPAYVDVMKNNPDIDFVSKMPFELDLLKKHDYHLIFEKVIEENKEASELNAVDLFLKEAGIDPDLVYWKDKIPRIYLIETEKKKVKKDLKDLLGYENLDGKKIGIQIQSSSPIRNFPLEKIVGIISGLLKKNYNVILFGGKSQREYAGYIKNIFQSKRIIDLPSKELSLLDSIKWTSLVDVMIAPDSSFIHIAGALDIPVVGLYGCFPSLLRMRYYKNAIGIDCNVPCAPSFIHGHFPCSKGSPSPCFSVISVENVLDSVEHLLGNTKINMEYPIYNEFKEGKLIKSGLL